MLAIMNVGKYATAPLPPGGEVIITKLSSQSVGITVDQFEKHNNTIIGIEYDAIGYVISNDNGETWQYIIADYPIGGVCYSDTLEGWCFIEGIKRYEQGATEYAIHKGFSSNGTSIVWSELEGGEVASSGAIPIAFLGHFVKQAGEHVIYAFAFYANNNGNYKYYRIYNELGDIVATYETSNTSFLINNNVTILKTRDYIYTRGATSTSYAYVFSISGVVEISYNTTWVKGCNNEIYYNVPNGGSQKLSKDPRVNTSSYSRPNPAKTIIGYFEISDYVYVFTGDNYIARANSLIDACLLANTEYTSVSDIGQIKSVLNLTDRKCLLASSGSIYLCEIK